MYKKTKKGETIMNLFGIVAERLRFVNYKKRQITKKITVVFLILSILLTNVNSAWAYPNNQTEFNEYLMAIGYPLTYNGMPANYTTYVRYNKIVYGDPFPTSSKSNKTVCSGSTWYEYRNLGYSNKGEIVTNMCYPNIYGSEDAANWNYLDVNGTGSWTNTNADVASYIKTTEWYGHGNPIHFSDIGNISKARIELAPSWKAEGSIYTKHVTSSGRIYYATFNVKGLAGPNTTVDGGVSTDQDTYTIPAGQNSVSGTISVQAQAKLSGSYMAWSQVKALTASYQGQNATTSAQQYATLKKTLTFNRKDYTVGTHTVTIPATVSVQSIFGDKESKNVFKKVTLIVQNSDSPVMTATGSTNPSQYTFPKGSTISDVGVKVTANGSVTGVADSKSITKYVLSAKDNTTGSTLTKTYTGSSAQSLKQTYDFNFTISKSYITNQIYTRTFTITASAYLSDGKVITGSANAATNIVPPMAPSIDNPDMTAFGSTSPLIKNFMSGILSDVNVTVTAKGTVSGVDNPTKITQYELWVKKALDLSFQSKIFTGSAAHSFTQSGTFSFTIPKYFFTDSVYTQTFIVVAKAVLSDGTVVTDTVYPTTIVSPGLAINPEPGPPPPPPPPLPPPVPPPNVPPKVDITGPTIINAGDKICLESTASDYDGYIVSQTWNTMNAVGEITGNSGCLYYKQAGNYTVTTTVQDNDGATSSTQHNITVLPPVPVASFNISGYLKENRKVEINSTSTSTELYPIDWSKSSWEITPLDSSNADAIKTQGMYSDSGVSSVWFESLFKKPGQYKIKLYVENTAGFSNIAEQTFTIDPDLLPTANFDTETVLYRDPNNTNKATIALTDKSFSEDDIIGQRIWKYKFDSNNDGNFDDEAWEIIDNTNVFAPSVDVTHVGKYLVEEAVVENFGQTTIDEFVTDSDRKTNDTSTKPTAEKMIEVKNLAPAVSYDITKKQTAYLSLFAGNNPNSKNMTTLINTKLRPILATENIDLNLNVQGLSTGKIRYKKSYDSSWGNLDGSSFSAPTVDVSLPEGYIPLGVSQYWNQSFGYSTNVPLIYVVNPSTGKVRYKKASQSTWSVLSGSPIDVAIPTGYVPLGVVLNYEIAETQAENEPYIYIINPTNGNIEYRKSSTSNWNALSSYGGDAPIDLAIPSGYVPLGVAPSKDMAFAYSMNIPTSYIINTTTGDVLYRKAFNTQWMNLNTKWVTAQTSTTYNNGGFSGNLNIYVDSGSYTPSDTKTVSDYRTSTVNSFSSSISYSSGGYTGTLYQSGSAYVMSGSPAAQQYVSGVGSGAQGKAEIYTYSSSSKSWSYSGSSGISPYLSGSYYYSSGGMYGYLSPNLSYTDSNSEYNLPSNPSDGQTATKRTYVNHYTYSGWIQKADDRIWEQWYSGSVTKPAVDTRVYRYQGYVTKTTSDASSPITLSTEGQYTPLGVMLDYITYGQNAPNVPNIYTINATNFSSKLVGDENVFVGFLEDGDITPAIQTTLTTDVKASSGYLIGLGTDTNKATINNMIAMNNQKGTYVNNNDIDAAISSMADYIIKQLRSYKIDVTITKGTSTYTKEQLLNTFETQVRPDLESDGILVDNLNYLDYPYSSSSGSFPRIPFSTNDMYVFAVENNTLSSNGITAIEKEVLNTSSPLLAIGSNLNQSQFNSIISAGKGAYYDSGDVPSALTNAASYIMSDVDAKRYTQNTYITLDQSLNYGANFYDLENDPKYAERWRYIHDPNVFENSMGVYDKNNQNQSTPVSQFPKVGKYQVIYAAQDNPVGNEDSFANYRLWSSEINNWNIYVHRKPVPNFTYTINASTGAYTITNKAYDLDKQSIDMGYGPGIKYLKYFWKDSEASDWLEGLPLSPLTRNIYQVKQVVYDFQGASESTILDMDATGINKPPIADFNPIPNIVKLGNITKFKNLSTDPNGDVLTAQWWIRNISPTTTAFTSPFSTQYEPTMQMNTLGQYEVKLRVTDPKGAYSEVTKTVTVVPNNTPPVPGMLFDSPQFIGNTILVTSIATDQDSDPLTYFYKLQKGSTILTYNTGDSEVGANGNLTLRFTNESDIGDWTITQTVNDGNISVSMTKTLTIIDLSIIGKVLHTPDWDSIHTDNGDLPNQFYSGEEFVFEADTTPQPIDKVVVSANIPLEDGTVISKEVNLNMDTSSVYKGGLLDQIFVDPLTSIKEGPLPFRFTVYYSNGIIKEDTEDVEIIGNAMKVLRLHRTY